MTWNRDVAASNCLPKANVMESATMSSVSPPRFSRALSIIPSDISTPLTEKPFCLMQARCFPVPQPTSIRFPPVTPASRSSPAI